MSLVRMQTYPDMQGSVQDPCVVYVSKHNLIYFLGGYNSGLKTFLTQSFNLETNKTSIPGVHNPPQFAIQDHACIYDVDTDVIYMFGGFSPQSNSEINSVYKCDFVHNFLKKIHDHDYQHIYTD